MLADHAGEWVPDLWLVGEYFLLRKEWEACGEEWDTGECDNIFILIAVMVEGKRRKENLSMINI